MRISNLFDLTVFTIAVFLTVGTVGYSKKLNLTFNSSNGNNVYFGPEAFDKGLINAYGGKIIAKVDANTYGM